MKVKFLGFAHTRSYCGALTGDVRIEPGTVIELLDDPADLDGGKTAAEKAAVLLGDHPEHALSDPLTDEVRAYGFRAHDAEAKKVAKAATKAPGPKAAGVILHAPNRAEKSPAG